MTIEACHGARPHGTVAARRHATRPSVHLLLLVLLPLLLLPRPAIAQSGGVVTGQVTDETGGVLPGVSVDLKPAGAAAFIETVTDETGTYRFEGVPAGAAELTIRLVNFTTVRQDVMVSPAAPLTVNAQLTLSLSADITVTAPRTFRNLADIENPQENLVGIASAASQGAITAAQLESRPIMRPAEVLETVPGLIVSQHSGEGKANQYYLRSFNLDHGSDFLTTVAGIPVNNPTHGHAQGYADSNFLIPELVSGVQFRKGPYYAEDGDFSAAGSANINYLNSLDRPIVTLSTGNQGWRRVFAAASPRVGSGFLLGGLEINSNDGPWDTASNYQRVNGILRYSRGDTRNGFSLTGMGYDADWDSTDQVPRRAIESGLIGRFGNIDTSLAGRSYRYSAVADGQRSDVRGSLRATAYAVRYSMNLFQNFTYFLADPVNGDQFEQVDRRWITGGRVSYRRLGRMWGRGTESAMGVQVRNDAIGEVALYQTVARQRIGTTRRDQVGQTSVGVYGQTEVEWSRILRTTVGLRVDGYRFDVTSDNPLNSGSTNDAIASPKVTAVLGPWASTEVYLNAGTGFHSNHGLGTVISVDPVSGDPAERVPALVRATGGEVGLRTVRIPGLQSTVSVWTLGFDSELIWVGDAGSTEAGRPSHRWGVEWTNYARPRPWLTVDLDLAFSKSRYTDQDPAGDAIAGALGRVISGGVTVEPIRGGLFGSVRLRHFGPRALTEDRAVLSKQTSLVNGELGYRFTPRTRLVAELFNLFDARVADIDYYYTSRLPGEPLDGVDDVHTHPAIPRAARVMLQVSF